MGILLQRLPDTDMVKEMHLASVTYCTLLSYTGRKSVLHCLTEQTFSIPALSVMERNTLFKQHFNKLYLQLKFTTNSGTVSKENCETVLSLLKKIISMNRNLSFEPQPVKNRKNFLFKILGQVQLML